MFALRKVFNAGLNVRKVSAQSTFLFSDNKWTDKERTEEKVYITKRESNYYVYQ